jgi:hypothetical protein
VLGWLAGASVPPVVALLLDPAVVVVWSFVDPLLGLTATALEAVVDCPAAVPPPPLAEAAFGSMLEVLAREAMAIIARTLARRRERLDLCE